jgi:nucleoside 2-deoxyribosyltransferase
MIKAYTCQSMTGRMCDEMIVEARMLERVLGNYGIQILNPVLAELDIIPNEHILLPPVSAELLEKVWREDKRMIREADIVIDYKTHNKSDGSNNEVGYNRFGLWKPTIRVWDGPGALISRMEHDVIVPTLNDAIDVITERFGTYEKLGAWREEMLKRSFPKWLDYQQELIERYSMNPTLLTYLQGQVTR